MLANINWHNRKIDTLRDYHRRTLNKRKICAPFLSRCELILVYKMGKETKLIGNKHSRSNHFGGIKWVRWWRSFAACTHLHIECTFLLRLFIANHCTKYLIVGNNNNNLMAMIRPFINYAMPFRWSDKHKDTGQRDKFKIRASKIRAECLFWQFFRIRLWTLRFGRSQNAEQMQLSFWDSFFLLRWSPARLALYLYCRRCCWQFGPVTYF